VPRRYSAWRVGLRRGLIAVGAIALLLWTLLPLYVLVMVSVVDRQELLNRPGHLFPHAPDLDQYRSLLKVRLLPPEGGLIASAGYNKLPLEGWVNSALVALAVVPLTLAIALPAAYAFSRLQFRYRIALLTALVLTRAYPPVSVLLPFDYILTRLSLTGNLPAIAVSHLTLTIPLITWIMCGFFAALPRNLEPAARIDGLTRFQALVRIVLPLSRQGRVLLCADPRQWHGRSNRTARRAVLRGAVRGPVDPARAAPGARVPAYDPFAQHRRPALASSGASPACSPRGAD
jgi:multiple sugar transport system permease protein